MQPSRSHQVMRGDRMQLLPRFRIARLILCVCAASLLVFAGCGAPADAPTEQTSTSASDAPSEPDGFYSPGSEWEAQSRPAAATPADATSLGEGTAADTDLPPEHALPPTASSSSAPSEAETQVAPPAAGRPLGQLSEVDREQLRARAAAAGLRELAGRHLTLYTDLPASPAVDELPAIFDQAVPHWYEYLQLSPDSYAEPWHVVGFLMQSRERFSRAGLIPASVPRFRHGYSSGGQFWLDEQPSDYYRRHLLLHEGTHAFLESHRGTIGPAWYAEGIAELLGTHRWADGELTLNYLPAEKAEVPRWGRIELVQEAVAAGRGLPILDVLRFDNTAHRTDEPYGWCWALATFLDRHPDYQAQFRALATEVADPGFNDRVLEMLGPQLPQLEPQWQAFLAGLTHGYDVPANAFSLGTARELPAEGATLTISAARGWQPTGFALRSGQRYRLTATGRYQVATEADSATPWISEPAGVTIRYHAGHPLGMLQAAIYPADEALATALTNLQDPLAVGTELEFTPREAGQLLLRVNDSPAELHDNAGELNVHIEALPQ